MRSLTFDARTKTIKGKFKPSARAEREFARQLKKVARTAAHIVEQHVDVDGVGISNIPLMQRELDRYSAKIGPWAESQAARLLLEVQKSNKRAYQAKSKALGQAITLEASDSHIGIITRELLEEQVKLIKSIPIDAGRRAQDIALKNFISGTRAVPDEDIIKELQLEMGMTEQVAVNRAKLIARTETARANSAFNQARAMSVGSGQYRWHNSGDAAVRHSHEFLKGKRLQGMIFSWDDPPTLDDGMTGNPGSFPNCRCFAEPVFDTE